MKVNQRQRIIDYINQFGSITSKDAYDDLGITQLATRIKELKEQGYRFETKWESSKNRYGEKVDFKRYFLEKEKLLILCVCIYTRGEEKGKKDTTKIIKQYWEESKNVNEFWAKFTILWKNNVGD
mgnify:CR=1 FL=1